MSRVSVFAAAFMVWFGGVWLLSAGEFPGAVNALLGVFAYIAAGVAAGVYFHHMSYHSIAQKAFHIFTVFSIFRITLFFNAYYFGGAYANFSEFLEFADEALFTGQLITRAGLYPIPAAGLNTFVLAGITLFCYLHEEEVNWTAAMWFMWAGILGMALVGYLIDPL